MEGSALFEKLAISKAIMDKHKTIERGKNVDSVNMNYTDTSIETPIVETFNTPKATYNIPTEYASEVSQPTAQSTKPLVVTEDLIKKSKLPDEIKKVMLENPITPVSPYMNNRPALSDELVEKATRLMETSQQTKKQQPQHQQVQNNLGDIRAMLKEVVREVLVENGLIVESTSKTNETMLIKVGQHIFEGKISKIKKTK